MGGVCVMAIELLNHRWVTIVHESGYLKGIYSFADFLKAWPMFDKWALKNGYDGPGGMFPEVVIGGLMIVKGIHDDLNTVNYRPTEEKYNLLDATGLDAQEYLPSTYSIKFRSNPTGSKPESCLTETELAKGANASLTAGGIVSLGALGTIRKQIMIMEDIPIEIRKDICARLHDTMPNMHLITSVYCDLDENGDYRSPAISHQFLETNKGCSITGRKQLERLLDGKGIWDKIRELVEISAKIPQDRIMQDPFPEQEQAIDAWNKFVLDPNKQRGGWYMACSSGKTLIERYMINYFNNGASVFVAPFINLVWQQVSYFMRILPLPKFRPVVICSRGEEEFYFKGENYYRVEAIQDEDKIYGILEDCLLKKVAPVCFFTTYRSAKKLAKALRVFNEEVGGSAKFNVVVFDEGHNVTPKQIAESESKRLITIGSSDYLDAFKMAFLTATPRPPMMDPDLCGEPECIVTVPALLEAKRIVPVEIVYLLPKPGEVIDEENVDRTAIIKLGEDLIQREAEARAIIYTPNAANQVESLVKDPELHKALPDFYICGLIAGNKSWQRFPLSDEIIENASFDELKANFGGYARAIFINCRIFKEGIDIPNANAVLSLRAEDKEEATQDTGRTIRKHPEDKENFEPATWRKKCAYRYIPMLPGIEDDAVRFLDSFIESLMECGYPIDKLLPDCEVGKSKTGKLPDPNNKMIDDTINFLDFWYDRLAECEKVYCRKKKDSAADKFRQDNSIKELVKCREM